MRSIIELVDIINYVGDFKRPFEEGFEIVKCNHIIEFHCTEQRLDFIKICALCLQTSDLNGKPHELEIIKSLNNNDVKLSAKCTCKAGSGKCKHIVGLMLKLQKTPEEDLNELSCTDLPQQWGKSGLLDVREMHKPAPIKEFCHVKPLESVYSQSLPDVLPEEMQQEIGNLFLLEFPQSAYAIHRFGRHEPQITENVVLCFDINMVENFITSKNIAFSNDLHYCFLLVSSCCQEDQNFFNTHIVVDKHQAKEICIKTLNQTGPYWNKVRQLRITGTSAYQYFTYYKGKKEDWDSKVKNVLFPKFSGNHPTRYGLLNEKKALTVFEKQYNTIITKIGFIININCPWLGFSPDGFFKVESDTYLIEIKCPLEGKETSGPDLIVKLKYVNKVNGELFLKKKHAYYGQIQLGLMLCNLKLCYLIIFSTFDNSIIIVNVHFDVEFCEDFFNSLSHVYFGKILPHLKNIIT